MSPDYAEEIREKIKEDKTQPLEYYEPMFEPQTGMKQSKLSWLIKSLFDSDHGTSHCSIIDAAGNAVAATSTVNTE